MACGAQHWPWGDRLSGLHGLGRAARVGQGGREGTEGVVVGVVRVDFEGQKEGVDLCFGQCGGMGSVGEGSGCTEMCPTWCGCDWKGWRGGWEGVRWGGVWRVEGAFYQPVRGGEGPSSGLWGSALALGR